MRVQRFRRHVRRLCKEHDITYEVKRARGGALVRKRHIRIPPIHDEMDYFVCLHEIGHVVNGLKPHLRLSREGLAWQWALDNALVEPHYSTRQRIAANVLRYWLRTLYRKKYKLPPSGDVFWRLLYWWV